jgi:esterase
MYLANRLYFKLSSRFLFSTKFFSTRAKRSVSHSHDVKLHSSLVESSVPGVSKYLVFLHGLFGNSNNWRSISYSESIRGLRRSLLIDMRNHGESDHHTSMTYSEMADDVIRHMDHLKIDKFTLLGHSMGGKVAMNLSIRFPDRLEGLVIVDSAPKDHRDNKNIYGGTKQIVEQVSEYNVEGKTRKEVLQDLKNMFNGSVANLLNTNLIYAAPDSDKVHWRCNLTGIKDNIDLIIGYEHLHNKFYEGPTRIILGEKSFIFPLDVYRSIFPKLSEQDVDIVQGAGKNYH